MQKICHIHFTSDMLLLNQCKVGMMLKIFKYSTFTDIVILLNNYIQFNISPQSKQFIIDLSGYECFDINEFLQLSKILRMCYQLNIIIITHLSDSDFIEDFIVNTMTCPYIDDSTNKINFRSIATTGKYYFLANNNKIKTLYDMYHFMQNLQNHIEL